MKYRYKLIGLDCPNCANKIECKLNQDKNINKATVNFSKLTLTVETDKKDNIKKYITNIVTSLEPGVEVLDISEEKKDESLIFSISRLIIGCLLSILGIFVFKNKIGDILIILGYIVLLYRTFTNAIKLLFKSKTINENLLVTISCIGAYFTNNIHEGLMVIILYEIGKILEQIAVNRSRRSISDLMDIKPEYANLKNGDQVDPNNVKVGDIIIVKQGEKIPLDGIVVKGSASLNASALTGESKLKEVKTDDLILSGSINVKGLLEVRVTEEYQNSTVYKILELVEEATDRKAKTETFVAKAAKVYTPIIIILSLLIIILFPLIFKLSFSDALYRALVFLVVSCPCAIAISVPLSYFTGIGASSKQGILIKGSDYLDSLSKIEKIIFDKTGTLTTGYFSDYKLNIVNKNYNKKEVINYYVMGEKMSNHPIAKSIVNIFNVKNNDKVEDFEEISGMGIKYKKDNKVIKIGSYKMCDLKEKNNNIYLTINDELVAFLELSDGIKKESKNVLKGLRKLNIKTKMFTGDDKDIALKIADELKIDEVEYSLLPEDKYRLLEEEIKNSHNKIAFVGDGINDAPSLALADIGISMGGIGSASAIEASDVVIMNDDLNKIITGINISKKTNFIIKQNLIFAITVKVLVLLLSSIGIATMWQAVFADTGVTLITIINTTRILKKNS